MDVVDSAQVVEEEPEVPSEQPIEPENPAEEIVETEEPSDPVEPQLFELPDGRKVDSATLAREFKENFLPDYTRKSQALAEIEKSKNKLNEIAEDPYAKHDYAPQNYREVIEIAKKEAIAEQEAKQQAEVERQKAFEESTANQIADLKTQDPNLNTDALFLHANQYFEKYGVKFPDLKIAYSHMKDVEKLTKNVQQITAKNIAKRQDPVSTTGKASGVTPHPGQFRHARDYFNAIKGSSQ